MQNRVSRRMAYADRHLLQQADQAIGKSVTRALVELITNSNDRYMILEKHGYASSGLIIIELQRRHHGSVLRVRDFATGMSSDDMDKKVGTYAGATSGFKQGESVRGLWGRGLKDSIYGLGHGYVYSIVDDTFNSCALLIKNGAPIFELEVPKRASRAIRSQFEMPSGNGAVVEIVISREDVRTPLFDALRRSLEHHFEIRAILGNPNRRVILREIDNRGRVRQEPQLTYRPPIGELIVDEVFQVPNSPAEVHLELFRSEEPLSMPGEEHEYADGGLLILSRKVVLGLTLFKFDSDEFASRLYGRVECDHFHELLEKDEPVLTATRDGVNWKHPFAKALKYEVERRLEPIIGEERRRVLAEQRSHVNKRIREKLNLALLELNEIASVELGDGGKGLGESEKDVDIKEPVVPGNGFGFVPTYAYVQTGKAGSLTLRAAIPGKLASGSIVVVTSDSPEVTILTPQVVIESRPDYPHIGQARVEIEGRQVGSEAIITAEVEGSAEILSAEAYVKVTSVRKPSPPPEKKGGLFKDFHFDPSAEPRQRVRFDQATSNIVIATKAPSVALYLGEDGEGIETPQAQVMLAELLTEAGCRELARRGVKDEKYIAPIGGEADAIQRKYIELQNMYAHRIHACIVQEAYRRNGESRTRRGRPRREDQLASAVTAA